MLLHGAGSTPEFIERAFGPAITASGWDLVAPDVRGMDMAAMIATIRQARPDAVGGVSLGAHASAAFAASEVWEGPVYAVMPAWMGAPDAVAALTEHTALEIEQSSVRAILDRLAALSHGDWIFDELSRAWRSMDDEQVVAALRVAGRQRAPTAGDLKRLRGRVTVVGLADDPTHPLAVAHVWARACGAPLHVVDRHAGPQALAAWLPGLLGRWVPHRQPGPA